MSDSQTTAVPTNSSRATLPLTSGAAAGRWFFRCSHGQPIAEIDDTMLLDWMRTCVDGDDLHTARFRRALSREWLTVEQASLRIRQEKGEILGARAGALTAALTGLPFTVLTHGGTPAQAVLLMFGLAAAGAAALIRRGPDVLPRVLIAQGVAALALGAFTHGLLGVIVALYLPLIFMALATVAGSRMGGWLGRSIHARESQRLAGLTTGPADRARDAVAA